VKIQRIFILCKKHSVWNPYFSQLDALDGSLTKRWKRFCVIPERPINMFGAGLRRGKWCIFVYVFGGGRWTHFRKKEVLETKPTFMITPMVLWGYLWEGGKVQKKFQNYPKNLWWGGFEGGNPKRSKIMQKLCEIMRVCNSVRYYAILCESHNLSPPLAKGCEEGRVWRGDRKTTQRSVARETAIMSASRGDQEEKPSLRFVGDKPKDRDLSVLIKKHFELLKSRTTTKCLTAQVLK